MYNSPTLFLSAYSPFTTTRPVSSKYVPTSLPPGVGAISSDLQASFTKTLDVMSKLDFRSLSHRKSIEWNLSLSDSCVRFSQEISLLQQQLDVYHAEKQNETMSREMGAFAARMLPHIKKHAHIVFSKLIFPSHKEVTTTKVTSLADFGLTSTSTLANMIFDEVIFKNHGSSAGDCISIDDNVQTSRHPYDTPEFRDDLWVNREIATHSIKEVGRVRNSVTNICRDTTSK